MKKLLAILLSVSLVTSIFVGCAKMEVAQTNVQNETKNDESTLIMRSGMLTTMKAINYEDDPKYPIYYYDDLNSMTLAYQADKLDSLYGFPDVVAKYISNHIEGTKFVQPIDYFGTIGLCIGTLKENAEVYNLLNNSINMLLNNGVIEKLKKEFLSSLDDPKVIEMPKIEGADTLKIAVTGGMPPIDYIATDGTPAGFNIALLSEISKIAKINFELVQVNSGARLTALKTNTVDAVFYNAQYKFDNNEHNDLYANEDLPEEIVITKPYYTSRIYEVDSIKKLEELATKGLFASSEIQKETNSKELQVIMASGVLKPMTATADFIDEPYYPTYYYEDLNSMLLSFKAGKIDSMYPFPLVTAKYIENHVENVIAAEPTGYTGTIGLCLGTLKEKTEVYNLLCNAIDKLSSNGTIKILQDEYIDKYLRTNDEPNAIEMPRFDNAKTIKIAVTGDMPPIDFVTADGKPAGFNVALLSEISKLINTNIELVQMNSGARLVALKTNSVDAVFYNIKVKQDNEDNGEIYLQNLDLPDDIIITGPYHTSRIYEVYSRKKFDELIEKGIISPQERTQPELQFTSGVLNFASKTEEENNEKMDEYGWGVNIKYFDNLSQMMLALRSGQIDYISTLPKSTALYIKARNNDIVSYKSLATNDDRVKYSMATLEESKEVYNILNDTLNEIIKDGTINNIKAKYIDEFIGNKGEPQSLDMPHFESAKTIKVAVTGDLPPFDFVSADGRPAGYNAALLSEIANRAKINIELVTMDEKAKVTALATKNIDAIFWLSSLIHANQPFNDCPEGAILTDSYYEDEMYLICTKDGKFDKSLNEN